ncbi:MAG: Calcineurin-like phosphoesterase [Candidatus Dependentiae bacterium ADurb.Bin331]|nr:MAG: Calcineurin-like phosphoesterase [Candidatus Dependentiae bacterium ADurb.Bin331]
MKRFFYTFVLTITCTHVLFGAVNSFDAVRMKTLAVPENTRQFLPPLITQEQLRTAAETFVMKQLALQRTTPWVEKNRAPLSLIAQKLIIPAQSTVLFFGEIHGNIHSLMRMLHSCIAQGIMNNEYKIIQPNTYFIFLGDYVDRGFYSTETLYTLLQFSNVNPDRVILLRGNHEDEMLNQKFGFAQELEIKFSALQTRDRSLIHHVFDLMPSVLYLGSASGNHTDLIQCCHGGIEIGYNPHDLLSMQAQKAFQSITKLDRTMPIRLLPQLIKKEVLAQIPANEILACSCHKPTEPVNCGLLWNDFIEKDAHYTCSAVGYQEGRGWIIGKKLAEHILSTHSTPHATIHAVFRAHQHHGPMLEMLKTNRGLVSLWNGLVYTFASCPIARLNMNFDSFGVLKTARSFDQWQLTQCIITPQAIEHKDIPHPFIVT